MKRLLSLIVLLSLVLSVRGEQAEVTLTSTFPRTGTVRVPVLLCAFPDQGFSVDNPQSAFFRLLNETGYSENGGTGSVAEYYRLASYGQLNLIFDVYGPYTVSHNMEYYGGNTGSSHSKNAREMLVELINMAGNDGVNFALYDANNDGVVDNVSVFFAGHNEAEGGDENTLWPHQSTILGGPTWNGKSFSSYLATSELRSNKGTYMAGIGTYCHEFGHVLGLPDLYNTSNNTSDDKVYTLGKWDIMCNGSYNNLGRTPPIFSAFERFMMGWHTPTQIAAEGNYSLAPIEENDASFLLASTTHNLSPMSPSPAEYFILENRQRTGWDGRHEEALPGVGLLVSHITFNERNWNNNSFNDSQPLGIDIVEAYDKNPKQSAPHDTYPGTMNVTTFTPVLNIGDSLHRLHLHNILQRTNGVVSFAMGDIPDPQFVFTPAELDTFVTTFDGTIVDYYPQTLTITGSHIAAETVTIAFSNNFYTINADTVWQKAGSVFTDSVNPDGSYSRTLSLRFEPRRQSCIPTSGQFQVFTGDSMSFKLLSVLGISPQPNYLTAPDSLEASEIETTSFRVSWSEVADAESYFLRGWFHDPKTGELTLADEREAVAPADHAYLTGLNANTEYLVTVTAFEARSCAIHEATSDTIRVATAIDRDTKKALPVVQNADGTCTLILPTYAQEDMKVYVFTTDGKLVETIAVPAGTLEVNIPTGGLLPQHLYLLKLTPATSFPRKAYFAKFILYR
ncbi:MAG: M6 family metalloprotease domain-containing protein [Paludibacteraceae bacterium]|nr:M6 family metalloprotease domain-containing protein [Paludibacteraceae bacterium]